MKREHLSVWMPMAVSIVYLFGPFRAMSNAMLKVANPIARYLLSCALLGSIVAVPVVATNVGRDILENSDKETACEGVV